MVKLHRKVFAFALIVLFLHIAGGFYAASAKSTAAVEAGWQSMKPIQARILLLIPPDFGGYVHAFSHNGSETRLPLGQQATSQLELLLRSAFTTMDTMPVANESGAKEMISQEDPTMRRYDLVAVPKFLNVSSWDSGPELGFNVDISLEISSFDTETVATINGHGESSTPEGGFSPLERLTLAVSYALDAIQDVIETEGHAWIR
jgi:hypothetical protein